MGLWVVTVSRYLGNLIGNQAAETEYIEEKCQGWTTSVVVMAGVACRHRQTAYAGLIKSLQQERDLVQWFTPGFGGPFILWRRHSTILPPSPFPR